MANNHEEKVRKVRILEDDDDKTCNTRIFNWRPYTEF